VRASCVVSQLASVVLFLIMFNCISLLGIRYARGFISLSVGSMAPSLPRINFELADKSAADSKHDLYISVSRLHDSAMSDSRCISRLSEL
jgi:hypothetical protein